MELYSHSHTELSSGLLREAEATCSPTGCLRRGACKKGLCEVNPVWTPTFRTLLWSAEKVFTESSLVKGTLRKATTDKSSNSMT